MAVQSMTHPPLEDDRDCIVWIVTIDGGTDHKVYEQSADWIYPCDVCHATGTFTRYTMSNGDQICDTCARSMLVDGDVIAVPQWMEADPIWHSEWYAEAQTPYSEREHVYPLSVPIPEYDLEERPVVYYDGKRESARADDAVSVTIGGDDGACAMDWTGAGVAPLTYDASTGCFGSVPTRDSCSTSFATGGSSADGWTDVLRARLQGGASASDRAPGDVWYKHPGATYVPQIPEFDSAEADDIIDVTWCVRFNPYAHADGEDDDDADAREMVTIYYHERKHASDASACVRCGVVSPFVHRAQVIGSSDTSPMCLQCILNDEILEEGCPSWMHPFDFDNIGLNWVATADTFYGREIYCARLDMYERYLTPQVDRSVDSLSRMVTMMSM